LIKNNFTYNFFFVLLVYFIFFPLLCLLASLHSSYLDGEARLDELEGVGEGAGTPRPAEEPAMEEVGEGMREGSRPWGQIRGALH